MVPEPQQEQEGRSQRRALAQERGPKRDAGVSGGLGVCSEGEPRIEAREKQPLEGRMRKAEKL